MLRLLLPRIWRRRGAAARVLWPLSRVYEAAVRLRRSGYAAGWRRIHRFPRPVVVIGGITVGGAGKTPLAMYAARLLADRGFKPGIVSRGYGGRPPHTPLWVDARTPPEQCGDEAAMMARRLGLPVVVDPDRPRAVRALLEGEPCDVVVSDDGLQHYAMDRQVEIAVIGGDGLGNGYCLPAGPLREPADRLREVDLVVRHGGTAAAGEYAMSSRIAGFAALDGVERRPAPAFSGRRVHAVAGTGYPEGFFDALEGLGMDVARHAFPDHYRYAADDFAALCDAPIVMTEKDAVKCAAIGLEDAWYAETAVELDAEFDEKLIELLQP